MTDRHAWNRQIIEEFRGNAGTVGGPFEGAPMLLLTVAGRRTGTLRTNPLVYLADGDAYVVFASKAGAPDDPEWYLNLLAHPDVSVEVAADGGTRTFAATARVVVGEERDRLYAEQARRMPAFAQYQVKTARTIPVVALVPQA